ncbi:MAG: ABC transporter permease subunit [Acetobacteraceae bacterium]|jgi:ABC-type dipeptide/oligopeptide/nickel transport system permease subunit|nr:ABC transporter permease subunit [Acetobacteraceae bacterium]
MPEAPGPGALLLARAPGGEEERARRPGPDPLLLATLAALGLLLAAPFLAGGDPLAQDLFSRNAPPSAEAWLGRDNLGRDVLARLVAGGRITLLVAAASALLALLLGAGVGLAALAAGPWASGPVYAVFDLVRAMPSVLLALSLLVALGAGFGPVVLALGLAFAPMMALVARAAWLRERGAGYVEAAVAAGGTPLSILRRHVAPNVAGVLVTQVAIVLPRCITSESVLSFLGLGVPPEVPSWGRMIAASLPFVERAPHALAAPALALAALTLLLALAGDRLRKRLDPMRAGT